MLNGGLGLALLILVIVIIRDFKEEFFKKSLKFRLFAAFLLLSIVMFSIKELYEYGPFDFNIDYTVEELLETLYMVFTIAAAFMMIGLRNETLVFTEQKR